MSDKPDQPVVPSVPMGQRVALVALAVILTPVMLFGAYLIVTEGGGVLLALAGAGFALWTVTTVGYVVRFLMTPRGAHEVVLREGATVLPESQVARGLIWIGNGAGLCSLMLLVGSAFLGSPIRVSAVVRYGAVAALVLALPTVVGVLRGKRPRGELVLTPEVVRLRTWSSEREVAWDDVVEVVALRRPRRMVVLYVDFADQVRVLRAPAGLGEQSARPIPGAARALATSNHHLTGDPAVLLAALDHWRRVRRDRVELGTEASLRRLDPGTP